MKYKTLTLPALVWALTLPASWAQTDVSESPGVVVHKDDKRQITRIEKANDITDFTYDIAGTLLQKNSTRFGITDFTYVPSKSTGPFARRRTSKQTSELGTWERTSVYDQEGQKALNLEGFDSTTLSLVADRLQPYWWPAGLRATDIESMDPIQGEDFASISFSEDEDGTEVQRIRVFDQQMEIRARWLDKDRQRREVRDDAGGKRVEIWSNNRTLLKAYDDFGPLIEAELDGHGRPYRVIIGGNTVLRFEFEKGSREWKVRHVTDLIDGELVGTWRRPDDFDSLGDAQLPGRRALAFLPGSIPIAEWDSDLWAEGAIQIRRDGAPYALIPFDGHGELWRSISTMFKGVIDRDRIDYTDSQIRILLSLGTSSIAAGSEVVILLERERQLSPPTEAAGQ